MIGMPVFTFLEPERRPTAERHLEQRALGVEDRQEVQLVRKDGTRIWVLGSANPIFDANGDYAGALGVLGDLTPQKRTEQRLRAELDVLERRLAALSRRPARARRPEPPPRYREPFRSAIVLAACGTFVATVAMLTASAVVGSLFGVRPTTDADA
jgi:PAS domain-containing protein